MRDFSATPGVKKHNPPQDRQIPLCKKKKKKLKTSTQRRRGWGVAESALEKGGGARS
jgi:hypothetical protein